VVAAGLGEIKIQVHKATALLVDLALLLSK
jgi:hypothetical protein